MGEISFPVIKNLDLWLMENTLLIFKDVILILNEEGTVMIMGEDYYQIDGEYREKVSINLK